MTAPQGARIIQPSHRPRRDALDAKLRRLLVDLRGALARALAESSEVNRTVQEIRKEGWALYLVVDQEKRERRRSTALELPPARSTAQPVFRIDGQDLTFLRSIGIDPTRSLKRRRG